MASGTIIRLILALCIILSPFVTYFFTKDNYSWLCFLLYAFLILIKYIENECDCENCIFSNRCAKTKKFNFVKHIMKFFGYNKDKINSIELSKSYENVSNTYSDLYKYILNEYTILSN